MPQVMVISSEGYFYSYSIDLENGGECSLLKQYRYVHVDLSVYLKQLTQRPVWLTRTTSLRTNSVNIMLRCMRLILFGSFYLSHCIPIEPMDILLQSQLQSDLF